MPFVIVVRIELQQLGRQPLLDVRERVLVTKEGQCCEGALPRTRTVQYCDGHTEPRCGLESMRRASVGALIDAMRHGKLLTRRRCQNGRPATSTVTFTVPVLPAIETML